LDKVSYIKIEEKKGNKFTFTIVFLTWCGERSDEKASKNLFRTSLFCERCCEYENRKKKMCKTERK
jgi:hypothetical protein